MRRRQRIRKLAIANRGEVAVRIHRAASELGIETALLHSSVDVGTIAYRLCDETVCIGGASSQESYLDIESNIRGAKSVGADAVHPGFGFLSENPEFVEAVEANGMTFVGPSSEAIRAFGDKISAKVIAKKASVPTVPGYQGQDQSLDRLLKECKNLGFPVIAKAAAGGGGRGLKVIADEAQANEQIQSAQREARAAFGSSTVFLEKYLDHAKHIEVQVFGLPDKSAHILFERECSVQRRHQKIIEEALSPSLTSMQREVIGEYAKSLISSVGYEGAGTLEFLLQDGQVYFMEMNTRLQVEHPVTELILGIDLVKAQILVAEGDTPGWPRSFQPRGHAIECRIYAEDPCSGGCPSTGRILGLHWPAGPGRRFEVGFDEGDEITPYYDPMIAKVIVWDETRIRAIQKMRQTLQETVIFGVRTNIPLLAKILEHADFVSGTMTTKFFAENFSGSLPATSLTRSQQSLIDEIGHRLSDTSQSAGRRSSPFAHKWEDPQ